MVQTLNSDFQFPDELPATPRRGGASSVKLPLVLVLIALTMFLPEESSFHFGEFRMTVYRLLLLLIAPAILFRFAKLAAGGNYRFVWSDVLVPVTGLWMFVGPAEINGFDQTLVYSGTTALEFCIPYMATRVFLTERGQAVALVRILCIAIATIGLLAIPDEFSRRFVLREFVGSLTGYHKNFGDYSLLMRDFLFRCASTLEHPIALGNACSFGLLMATTMRGALRKFMLAGSAVGLALSVSSAPIGGAIVGFGALLYNKLLRNFPFRWGFLYASAAGVILLIFNAHPNPWGFIFNHFTFDSSTAYYRLMQWEFVGPLVMDSPIFGIGLFSGWQEESGLAPTIDSNWLLTAMSFGIPGSILIGLSYITACSVSMDIGNKSLNLTKQERQLGFVLSVITGLIIYVGFTVDYWGTISVLTMFLAGIRAHLGALGAMPRELGLDDDG
ncbi:MAG: O-antigen ligase family protein [Methylocella sp.]